MASRIVLSLTLALLFVLASGSMSQAQVLLDFEDGSLDSWEIIDELPENLGDAGPGAWEIRDSQVGLDGKALYQGSNIWGTPGDTMLMGTFAIYKGKMFDNFTLEIDVAAADNDGMGIVWAYESTARHYRIMMINDGWPSPPLDGNSGPMLIAHKRTSDQEPWYELIDVVNDVTYAEGTKLHWTLDVNGGSFTFMREDGVGISGDSSDYESGYIGLQLYAQQVEFDNIEITPIGGTAVDPAGKLGTVWANVKAF